MAHAVNGFTQAATEDSQRALVVGKHGSVVSKHSFVVSKHSGAVGVTLTRWWGQHVPRPPVGHGGSPLPSPRR